jgi:hypothetical protein
MNITSKEAHKLSTDIAERLYYIAKLNPRGVNKLATKYGYQTPKDNLNSKFNFLALFFQENGSDNKAIDQLLLAHPDFNLFAETLAMKSIGRDNAVSPYSGPLQYHPDEDDDNDEGYMNLDEFGNYDGFIDTNDTYVSDPFIGAIADAVKGVAGTVGKFAGKGKKGRAAQANSAAEATTQARLDAQSSLVNARAAEKIASKEQKSKTKRIIIISSISAAVLIGLVLVYVFVIRKKK